MVVGGISDVLVFVGKGFVFDGAGIEWGHVDEEAVAVVVVASLLIIVSYNLIVTDLDESWLVLLRIKPNILIRQQLLINIFHRTVSAIVDLDQSPPQPLH